MASAQFYSGIAKGLRTAQLEHRDKPLRDARLAEAKSKQTLAEEQLQEYREGASLRKSEAELAAARAQAQLRSVQAASLKQESYNAFDRYEADNDIKHLNNWLKDAKKIPMGNKIHSNVVRLDEVTRTPQSENMLKQAGVTDLDAYFAEPKMFGNYVMATDPSGKQELKDMDQVYKATGYTQYATSKQLEGLQTRTKIKQLQTYGVPYTQMGKVEKLARSLSEALNVPYPEALKMAMDKLKKTGSTQIERMADELQKANPGMSRVDALNQATLSLKSAGTEVERETSRLLAENPDLTREQAQAQAKRRVEKRTSAQKDISAAENVREDIHKIAGGDFWSADLTDATIRRKLGPKISALEKLTGKELSQEDKRVVRNMRELTDLGETAGGNITDAETGLIDRMLHGVKKYTSDNVSGVAGTSAYATFRNTFRHALYGSALTPAEIQSFNEAAGTLGQQTGPVLQQLAAQMQTIKSQLQSVYDMNDEMIAQYYLGRSRDDIDQAIEQLEERIKLVSGPTVQNIEDTNKPTVQDTTRANRPSLDEIFKGVN